jgi:hypothetical protein
MNPHLDVERPGLTQALKAVNQVLAKKRGAGEAIFSYEDNQLQIDVGGLTVYANASGDWPGQARVSRSFAVNLIYGLHDIDPIPMRVDSGRLYVGNLSTTCAWSESQATPIFLPVNANLADILATAMNHSPAAIGRAGLTQAVLDAEEQRSDLEARAAKILAPLGITLTDLHSLADACIKRTGTT